MLHTIEVEIDAKGVIHPLEPIPLQGKRRGLLTILADADTRTQTAPSQTVGIDSLFGLVKADHSVSLEDMEAVIRQRGSEL
jgi:hypothetical protein